MNDSTPASDQTSLPVDTVEAELNKLVKHGIARGNTLLENNAERIKSSLAQLSSSSIADLEALTVELKRTQDFLRSEVNSIQQQIEGALAGINIIIETIAPWKNSAPPPPPPAMNARTHRAGPAASIEIGPARKVAVG